MKDLFNNEGYVEPDKPTRFCRTCVHRQPWECGQRTIQYCGIRKSRRTNNGLLKIKVTNPACLAYKEGKKLLGTNKAKRMKSIKEKAKEYAKTKHTNMNLIDIVSWDFEAGANYVITEIENFMKGLDLGNSTEEKFYKLDVLSEIGLFIKQLKK